MAHASCATFSFAARQAIGPEVFLGLRAPVDGIGKGIIFLACAFVIHLFAAQMTAGEAEIEGFLFGWHSSKLCLLGACCGHDCPLHGGSHQLNFVGVTAQRFRAFASGGAGPGGKARIDGAL